MLDLGHQLYLVDDQLFKLIFNDCLVNDFDGEIGIGIVRHVGVKHLTKLALAQAFSCQFDRSLAVRKENNFLLSVLDSLLLH